ncbi:methyltransferase domain-containing protein [Candidatus Bathyarchaeota archaeon]|nr:methyltransferase domain-containing protein [Candidatus Bathyarchaeota archaeon]
MLDVKEQIYDEVYGGDEAVYEPPSGIIGFLYNNLEQYNVTRYQTTYELLPDHTERILDIGCGGGHFLFFAKEKLGECYGVDVSSKRILQATQASALRPDAGDFFFTQCDVDKGLDFPDDYFDAVTCIATIEHVFNPPNLVREIHRVVKPGGVAIIQTPNFAWLPHRLTLLAGRLPTTGGVYLGADWEHLHNFTQSSLRTLVTELDFKVESVTCTGIFAGLRRLWVSLLGGDLVFKVSHVKR